MWLGKVVGEGEYFYKKIVTLLSVFLSDVDCEIYDIMEDLQVSTFRVYI